MSSQVNITTKNVAGAHGEGPTGIVGTLTKLLSHVRRDSLNIDHYVPPPDNSGQSIKATPTRVPRMEELITQLADTDYSKRISAIADLTDTIPVSAPKIRLALALKIEKRLEDEIVYVRRCAIDAIVQIIPHLAKKDRLARALKLEERLGDGYFRYSVIRALVQAITHLTVDDRWTLAIKIEERLKDKNPDGYRSALKALGRILPYLQESDKLLIVHRLWGRNLLPSTEFEAGGESESFWHHLIQAILPHIGSPKVGTPPSLDTIPEINLPSQFSIGAAQYGRSTAQTMADGALLVFKDRNAGQPMSDLLRELAWAHRVKDMGLKSALIETLGQVNGSRGIFFKAPANYYRYLTDAEISFDQLKESLFKAIHDTFLLANQGLYHLVPIRLFHNAETHNVHRSDLGRYTWMPGLVFEEATLFGMGRLDNWNGALEFGNYGQSGLRDLEELATLDEIINSDNHYAPELRNLKDKPNAATLYDMAILGNHLLSGMLYIGNHLRHVAQADDEHTFWKDDKKLTPFAKMLHEMFSLAYAVKHQIDETKAQEIMKDKAKWIKLARQMAFFMTKAYVPYVKPDAAANKFPIDIYGPETKIEITSSGYRQKSFHEEVGWLGPSGQTDQLSLGPVNGQFPIREFEPAAYATFIPWHALQIRMGTGLGMPTGMFLPY